MKKLGCLYTGLLVLSFSVKAMDSEVIELDTASPVEYTLRVAQTLKEAATRKCVETLVSNSEYSTTLLGLLEDQSMEVRDMVKAALINDYLVMLCELFKKELTVKELDYYKKREPKEGLSEDDCLYEGVVAGVLTSDDGIVFLSFRKEGHEYGTYLDYWVLGDLVNNEIKEKKPRCQSKIPVRFNSMSRAMNFFPKAARMVAEPGTNRFLIFFCDDMWRLQSECQLWCLGEEGFEHELTLELIPRSSNEFRFSPDGRKISISTGPSPSGFPGEDPPAFVGDRVLFEDVDTLKKHAVEKILKKDQVYSLGISGDTCANHPLKFVHGNLGWSLESGIIARLCNGLIMIEHRDADDISQVKACLRLSKRGLDLNGFSTFRILARGRYLLASAPGKVWLIDTVSRRAECVVARDVIGPLFGVFMLGEDLKMSDDKRFAIITCKDENPILYDLQRKMNVEIKVGSEGLVSVDEVPASFRSQALGNGFLSTYLTSTNDMLLSRRARQIRFVCLKSVLKAKSLRELVGQIKKRNVHAVNRENTHHQYDGE